jgi:penicillin-binding protein 2
MPSPLEERRPAITPQLAVRVAILGGFAFVLFATVFFRLWFLQVLSGEDYVSQAASNKVRKVRIDAARGDIVDRNGEELVTSRNAAVVQMLPERLPEAERKIAAEYGKAVSASEIERLAAGDRVRALDRSKRRRKLTTAERHERRVAAKAAKRAKAVPLPPLPADEQVRDLYRRVGRVIGLNSSEIHRRVVQQVAQTPYAAVTIKTDVEPPAYNYLKERAAQFPGVKVEKQYLREYPHKDLAAQLFGTIGEVSPEELKQSRYKGVLQGERIGKSGVEYRYDRWLRGESGYYRQTVDAQGSPCGDCPIRRQNPRQGYRLQLTIDLGLQRAAQTALAKAIAGAASNGAKAGAFVAMDPRNGEVFALGSVPSFDANLFAKPISQAKFDQLNSEASGKPLYNRAIAGVYPTGSTFKVVTATAALESGLVTPASTIVDTGLFKAGPQEFRNAKQAVFGPLQMADALKVSSDVFFYILGARMNPMDGRPLQTWAKRLGLGTPTGIDIPGEFAGLVPDARWRNDGWRKYEECVKRNHLTPRTTPALLKCGGVERGWSLGDNVNLAVGQGDLQATPLQMAVAYSTIANGGTLVRPHLGQRVEDGQGRLITKIEKQPRRRVKISQSTRSTILEGLRRAAGEAKGTSADVFKGFPLTVYGKTGTVERPGQADQSWYVAYVSHPTRPIVVAVTVEKGGFGAEAAAPAACDILKEWFVDAATATCSAGTSQTR